MLFDNAKSVSKGLDTAYTYLHAIYDDDGVCINLEGLVFMSETDGYRLPNEAEWLLAASQGWNPSESWNASNSKYRAHEVCGKKKNDLGLCDMAGNVIEWVNDWMGPFRDTTVNDFMGASERNGVGERVLKGGGYKNQKDNINLYARGDVYTVTSSTKAAYVGMRLARGRIPSPEWLAASGAVEVSKTYLVANTSTLRNVVKMDKMKLVFRDELTGHLNFVDYSKGVIGLTEIKDSLDAYHPDVSPDGSKVAFCTGLEGVSGASSVYVRDLDATGSNLVKLDVENASIPRWYVMPNGVLITVLLLTVFVDLLIAVGIGMIIACVLFMKRASDLVESGYQSGEINQFDKELPWKDEHGLSEETKHQIYIQRLNGPIFFGSITRFQEVMHDVPDDVKIVIIRMRLVSFMDQSGLYAMETAIKDLQATGKTVLMTIIQPQPMYMLTKMNVIPAVVPKEHTFATFEECTEFLENTEILH